MSESLVPYLTFREGGKSLAFLTAAFGFDIVAEQRDDGGGVMHAELRRDGALVMGGEGDAQIAQAPGIYLVVDDVEQTFQRAVDAGADVVYGPETTEWGTQRARVRDLDGHEWSFGTYQPGQSW